MEIVGNSPCLVDAGEARPGRSIDYFVTKSYCSSQLWFNKKASIVKTGKK